MDSSSTFHFKRNPVYGLPTFWGGLMFVAIGISLWFSISSRAPLEQWISFLMILLVLLHLAEANNPFRFLVVSVLPFEPPFAGDKNFLSLVVSNPTSVKSENLYFRLDDTEEWFLISELNPKTSKRISLPMPALRAGKHEIPHIRIKTRPASNLFQLWKVMQSENTFLVLPEAIDQGVRARSLISGQAAPELSHLEFIHDDRLLFKMDQKIFLKTGKPYFRAMEKADSSEMLYLDWSELLPLPHDQREKQFSAWLKHSQATSIANSAIIHVDTPFFKNSSPAQSLNWHALKHDFAKWVYEKP